jgi:hypothetical protein
MKNLVKALRVYEDLRPKEEDKLTKSAALFYKAACNDSVLARLRRATAESIGKEENESIENLLKAIRAVRVGKLYRGSALFYKAAEDYELTKILAFWDALAGVDAGVVDDAEADDENEEAERDEEEEDAM